MTDTRSVAGWEGWLRGTTTWLASADAACADVTVRADAACAAPGSAATPRPAAMATLIRNCLFIIASISQYRALRRLLQPLAHTVDINIAVETVEGDLRAARADLAAVEPIAADDAAAIVTVGDSGARRERAHVKVTVDGAVEALVAEHGVERGGKVNVHLAVERGEGAVAGGVGGEDRLHPAVDGARLAGAGHVLDVQRAVDVVHQKASADAGDRDVAAVDGVEIHTAVGGHVQFEGKAGFVARVVPVAVLLVVAAEGPVRIDVDAVAGLVHLELDIALRLGHQALALGGDALGGGEADFGAAVGDHGGGAVDVVHLDQGRAAQAEAALGDL